MTYGECPCVPAAQCDKEPVSDGDIQKMSELMYAEDYYNVYGALEITVDPGPRQR